MENKFRMTVEENVFTAKRNIIDYIWKSARLEGLGVTYPDAYTAINFSDTAVPELKSSEIEFLTGLKNAWDFILDTLDVPTDFKYISKLNSLFCGNTQKNCTESKEFAEILRTENPTERAITLMLYCMRSQMFLDGNKRTAMLAANHEMILNGCGIISVPIEKQREFTKLLVEFYETGEQDVIADFVYNECIDGIDFDGSEK